ncbi:hypothetical protein CIB48_g10677 [Xylaria polymorpha]|nr:hypothetical protein CIB48_g10677 [Xylaria polymorpha]
MLDVADLLASLPPAAREATLNGPAHAPPKGVVPNFDNPPSQTSLVIGVVTSGIWDKTVQGTCLNEGIIWAAYSCLNLASDVIILILPQKVIWGLKLSKPKKIGISIIFAFGLLACVAATLRIVTSVRKARSTETDTQPSVSEQGLYEQVDEYSLEASGGGHNDNHSHYQNEPVISASATTLTTHVITVSEEHDPNTATFGHQLQHPWITDNHFPAQENGYIPNRNMGLYPTL